MSTQSDRNLRNTSTNDTSPAKDSNNATRAPPPTRSAFDIPPTLKRIFDRFPLVTYPSNTLPVRSPRNRQQHILHVFTTSPGRPSYNPNCLKWQTYLRIAGIPFTSVASNNHASPSGALPFLIPRDATPTTVPLTAATLPAWIRSTSTSTSAYLNTNPAATKTPLLETLYTLLLTGPIRLAYLYALYLHPLSFRASAQTLYIDSASRSSFIRFGLTPGLRQAALDEILKEARSSAGGAVDVERLVRDAEEAFEAISSLLGNSRWFGDAAAARYVTGKDAETREGARSERYETQDRSNEDDEFAAQGGRQRDSSMGLFEDNGDDHGNGDAEAASENRQDGSPETSGGPSMLDAAVFSYTYVILSLFSSIEVDTSQETWSPAKRLADAVTRQTNLVEHRDRILKAYYPG